MGMNERKGDETGTWQLLFKHTPQRLNCKNLTSTAETKAALTTIIATTIMHEKKRKKILQQKKKNSARKT